MPKFITPCIDHNKNLIKYEKTWQMIKFCCIRHSMGEKIDVVNTCVNTFGF